MAENYISSTQEKGSINISEDVVVTMVAAAIKEVEGVSSIGNNNVDIIEKIGLKSASKGVKVKFEDDKISVDTVISVRSGMSLVDVATEVQQVVSSSVEAMTGILASCVNVHVAGVVFEK